MPRWRFDPRTQTWYRQMGQRRWRVIRVNGAAAPHALPTEILAYRPTPRREE